MIHGPIVDRMGPCGIVVAEMKHDFISHQWDKSIKDIIDFNGIYVQSVQEQKIILDIATLP